MTLHIGGPSGLVAAGDVAAALLAEKARADSAYMFKNDALATVSGVAAVQNRNLYDPADPDVLVGYVLNTSGVPVNNTGSAPQYTTTGYIPVTAGQPYTISNARSLSYYNSSKVFVSNPLKPDSATITVTPAAGVAYLRASFVTASYAPTFQIEQGSSATQRTEYGYSLPHYLSERPCVVELRATTLSLTTRLGASTLLQTFSTDRVDYNRGFNINATSLDGVSIHEPAVGDEVAPLRTQMGTIGGDHAFHLMAYTNPDGKTTADLGSVWTDGSREYVLLGFESTGELQIGGSYTTTLGVTSMADVAPSADLVHVSGATHAGTIVRAGGFATQMYPSTGRHRVQVFVDGERLRADGTYRGERMVVRESYEVLDYKDLYDKAKANIGVSYVNLNVVGAVRMTNTFVFSGNGRMRLSWTLTEMLPTTLGDCGLVQSVALSKSGATIWRHIPGLTPISGYDFANGIDLTSYAVSLNATTSTLRTAGVPPIFSLDRAVESGATTVGFAQGYLPFASGVTSNTARIASVPTNLWDMRSSKKSYANAVNTAAGWGRLTGEAFRTYLSPTEVDAAISSPDALQAWAALDAVKNLTSPSVA